MPFQRACPLESRGNDSNSEMTLTFAGSGMSNVQMAIVHYLEHVR